MRVLNKPVSKPTNPVLRYFYEARGELRKVTWPTRDEAWRLTLIVLAVTIAFALFLWAFDTVFSNGIQLLLDQLIGL